MPQLVYTMKRRRLDRKRIENNAYRSSNVNKKKEQGILKTCFALAIFVWLIQSSITTYQNVNRNYAIQSYEVETDLSSLLTAPISFASKRKLIHVISPFAEACEQDHILSETMEPEIKAEHRASGQQRELCTMFTEQMTVLLSIKRSRDVFDQYILMEKAKTSRYNMTDHHEASNTAEKGVMSHFAFDEIELVCAVLAEDIPLLQSILQTACDKIVSLPRSTKTEYGFSRSLPFLQDILEVSQSHIIRMDNFTGQNYVPNLEQDDNFYLFSNADIGLSRDFYVHMDTKVRERHASALSINRMTLDISTKRGTGVATLKASDQKTVKASSEKRRSNGTTPGDPWESAARYLRQADDLIASKEFRHHPGYDCFLFHSSVLKAVHFGDFFVGFPPFGANVHLALRIMAPNYANLESNPDGTFHLGNDRDWHTVDAKPKQTAMNSSSPSKQQSIKEPPSYEFWAKFQKDLYYLPWCPISNHPPPNEYAMQNSINCGKWFHPNRRWSFENPKTFSWMWSPTSKKSSIPAFVQDGFEAIYLHNYAKHLNYTSEGMPLVRGHQTPKIKSRRPRIVKKQKNREKRVKNKQDDGLVSFLLYQCLQIITSFSK